MTNEVFDEGNQGVPANWVVEFRTVRLKEISGVLKGLFGRNGRRWDFRGM